MEQSTEQRGDWMQTYTGRAFFPLEPRAEDVHPLDIAHALAMICRYGGHVSGFYSVAEHCVLMSHAVDPRNALWALLHDATEAYVGDMVRPLKYALPEYRFVENRIMTAICDRFGLEHSCPPEVKAADTRILRDERDALMPGPPPLPWASIENAPALGVQIEGWSPDVARTRFLNRWRELSGEKGCPDGPHRGPEGPNEDLSQCTICWAPTFALRPDGETFGDHLPDCRLTRRHESHCKPGGPGHPTAPTIRGYWPERCDDPKPHGPHEHYGSPAALRRECPGRR